MNIPSAIRHTAALQAEHLVSYLALRRDGLGVSRQLLAQRIGIGEAELRSWERGERQPDLLHLIAWMVALGMNAVFEPSALASASQIRASASNNDWITALSAELDRDVRAELVASPRSAAILRLFDGPSEGPR